jgi:glycosyltransferase involved in cell wall biosynthesis
MSGRGRVCIHAVHLWPQFSGGRVLFAGGAETQQALIARGLVARGFEVTVVTCDYGQPRDTVVEAIRFLSTYPSHGGIPVLRFFYPRLWRTVAALNAADADVYYVRGAGLEAGITYDVARSRRAAFVLGTAHDLDTVASLDLLKSPRDRWWQRRALRGADLVIAQTELQQRNYQEQFGRESVVVPNAVEIPEKAVDAGQDGYVVWLGTWKASKRPEWVIETARRLPQHRFVMCGVLPVPPDPPDAWEAAQAAARGLPNLEVRGPIPHERIGELFAGASLFVHSSPAEGFPNTMLEAWAHGLPVVSAVDPGGAVSAGRLGEVTTDVGRFGAAVERWMSDPGPRRDAGSRAQEWVRSHHASAFVLDRHADLMQQEAAK